ncbi:RIO1 family regulatory kinase/ATPase [Chelativorans oligotrophicus]|nr:RIO1 family regulatory kinase/ATPase [Chelativorans oligotrophicus]
MTSGERIEEELPSPAAQEALLRLLVQSAGQRISSAVLDGRTVWIKRYDAEPRPIAKQLHELFSPLMPKSFLRASRRVDRRGMAEREVRKMQAFREAGFEVPALIHRGETVIVLSHVAEIVQHELLRLQPLDPKAHDELLVGAAAALAHAHSAGLCHGRPHTRDMFVSAGRWGFVDFEEEPETVMPLRAAQARDIWLLFMQISARAILEDTEERAFAAYVEAGPTGSLEQLGSLVRFFSPVLPPLAMLKNVALGNDLRRFL